MKQNRNVSYWNKNKTKLNYVIKFSLIKSSFFHHSNTQPSDYGDRENRQVDVSKPVSGRSEFNVSCEQALHLRNIVKSRRPNRRACSQAKLIVNFRFSDVGSSNCRVLMNAQPENEAIMETGDLRRSSPTLLAEAFPLCFSALYCHSLRGFGCSRFVLVAEEKTSADSRLGFLLSMREMKMRLPWNFCVTCR